MTRISTPAAATTIAALTLLGTGPAAVGKNGAVGHAVATRAHRYAGFVSQPLTPASARPSASFTLSSNGKTITRFKTSAPPKPSMYPSCGGGGYSVAGNQFGFPSPVMHVQSNGHFNGRATHGNETTVIAGRFRSGRATATGTITLSRPVPGNGSCPAHATFSVLRG